jgi:hypothetical protein
MSKQNKVNPGQYYVAGRLSPDDMARERLKQLRVAHERVNDAPLPPMPRPRVASVARAVSTSRATPANGTAAPQAMPTPAKPAGRTKAAAGARKAAPRAAAAAAPQAKAPARTAAVKQATRKRAPGTATTAAKQARPGARKRR